MGKFCIKLLFGILLSALFFACKDPRQDDEAGKIVSSAANTPYETVIENPSANNEYDLIIENHSENPEGIFNKSDESIDEQNDEAINTQPNTNEAEEEFHYEEEYQKIPQDHGGPGGPAAPGPGAVGPGPGGVGPGVGGPGIPPPGSEYLDGPLLPPVPRSPPFCGNGIVEGKEQCDDGNDDNTDGCNILCKVPFCGNAVTEEGETCDDGNDDNTDGCSTSCQIQRCGNNILDTEIGEECEDGNLTDGDGCSADCKLEGSSIQQ